MSKIQRINDIFTGLLMILASIIMIVSKEEGYLLVLTFLSFSFFFLGIRTLYYYHSMAKNMVGGKEILYKGILILDFGLITLSLTSVPNVYIMLYLFGINLFSGVVGVLRAHEAKHYEGSSWKLNLSQGIINILIALTCIININSTNMVVYVYGIGLLYLGIVRIIRSFMKTAIVYIQ